MNIRRRRPNGEKNRATAKKTLSRNMRSNPTEAERRLWRHLRRNGDLPGIPGTHFRRQVLFGKYIVDFASHKARLIIEVDGGQHSEHVDATRTRFLEREGYRVLRFWNTDVMTNIEGVIEEIHRVLTPTPNPSPQGGGE